ncbi:MAG: trigger factor [Oscillospiraceae bacterium]|nr:trigger factor [Oscillospiraceae bacterium]
MEIKSYEQKEHSTALVTVTIDKQKLEDTLNTVYKKERRRVSVPGFRPGKAPRKLVESMYGAEMFYPDALDLLFPEVYIYIAKEKDIKTVGYPQFEGFERQEDGTVDFSLTVSIYPEVTLGEYKGVEAVRPSEEVKDSVIDAEIESYRLQNARTESVTRPAIGGDTVTIDYLGSKDGVPFDGGADEDYELTLGSNTFIPGFETKIQGMVIGEERDIDLTFPAEYHAEDLAGKDVVFHVAVKDIKSKILPDADDELAKDVSEFDTLDELKASIREKKAVEAKEKADSDFENNIIDKVVENMTADIPPAMVDAEVENRLNNERSNMQQYGIAFEQYLQMMGMTVEKLQEQMRPSAERLVKARLAMRKIAEVEAFEATAEDIEKYVAEVAEKYGIDADTVRDYYDDDDLKSDILMQKARDFLREASVATEAPPEAESEDDLPLPDADLGKEDAEATDTAESAE